MVVVVIVVVLVVVIIVIEVVVVVVVIIEVAIVVVVLLVMLVLIVVVVVVEVAVCVLLLLLLLLLSLYNEVVEVVQMYAQVLPIIWPKLQRNTPSVWNTNTDSFTRDLYHKKQDVMQHSIGFVCQSTTKQT